MEKKAAVGFDVSSLVGSKELKVWVRFNEDAEVQVRPVARDRFAAIVALATVTKWDDKHQKTQELDNLKFGELLGEETLLDWRGFVADGEPLPCTPENRKLFMRKWVDFARFIADLATDLERMVAAEKEAERKNLPNTSGPVKTIPV